MSLAPPSRQPQPSTGAEAGAGGGGAGTTQSGSTRADKLEGGVPTSVPAETTTASSSFTTRRRGGGGPGTTSEFHVPSGKKILVALPEEAARLRAKYKHATSSSPSPSPSSTVGVDNAAKHHEEDHHPHHARHHQQQHKDNSAQEPYQIEIVIHGSPEHSAHLHSARKHHEAQREAFVRQFGNDFHAWESSRVALDEVNRQLAGLEEHEAPSALNANFGRFGYSATLKTYNVPRGGSTPGSSRASLDESDSDSGTLRNWDDTSGGRTIRLFQRPVIKQYFHKGLLWRNSEQTEIMSFELFFELIYVGIIHYNGEHVADKTDALELGRFIITFVMSWQIWSDVQQGISWFEANDVAQRVYILFIIACLLGFTTNMTGTFNAEYDMYTQLVGFYIAARLATALFYGIAGILLPLVKGFMMVQVTLITISSMIWIGSIFVSVPSRFALIVVAMLLDYFGPSIFILPFSWTSTTQQPKSRRLAKFYDFWPATNIEHRVERTNAFVALVIGWAVVALLYQNAAFGFNAILGKAFIGLVQAFVFNWIYFEVDGENIHLHAIRRSKETSGIWNVAHLPFICAYTLSSAAMSKIVVASDSPNSDPASLEAYYADKSKAYVTQGVRWAYCVGLGVALLNMGVISICHVHKTIPGMRVPKKWRMLNRGVVCLVFFCLPLVSYKQLNSLALVSVTMGLMVWVLLLEIWGKSCSSQTWCGKGGAGGDGAGGCRAQYEARCSRKTLEKALRENAEVRDEEENGGDAGNAGERVEGGGKADFTPEVEILRLSRNEKTAIA